VVLAIVSDSGGIDRVAEVRLQLIRRFAAGCCLAEALEARMAQGAPIDVAEHCQLSGALSRIAARIGLNRVAKDATTLQDYIGKPAKAPPVEIEAETVESEPETWDGLEP
jgi:hypothetical protein